MDREIKKHYTNGEIDILWEPAKCIHAGICVKELPQVYHPQERPWITPENATTEQLINQIKQCPSGALSYTSTDESNPQQGSMETVVEVLPNGPLLIYGTLKVTDSKGVEVKDNKTTAFCRCGASQNKPYCDGAHVKINFQG